MSTDLRRRVVDALHRKLDPRSVAWLGSAALTLRSRSRCTVRFDRGQWIHRYPDGVVVNTALGGLSARLEDREAEDLFLYDYRPREGDVVFDVGAGVGSEVRLFSRLVGPAGRVVSVEAHPRTYACLAHAVELNQLTNVTLVQCAVTEETGPCYLEDAPAAHISNALTTNVSGAVAVRGRRLDELMSELGVDRVDLLKMNIEGAELSVLESIAPRLDQVRHLVVACHDHKADRTGDSSLRTFAPVVGLLREAGYAVRTRPDDARPWVRGYVYAALA